MKLHECAAPPPAPHESEGLIFRPSARRACQDSAMPARRKRDFSRLQAGGAEKEREEKDEMDNLFSTTVPLSINDSR